jgi:hypothetical protein
MAAAQSRARSTGRNDTNGRLRTNSRAAASERRSSQPRIHVISRNLHGCRRRKSTATAKLSSSERNRCSGVNDSLPICTWSAGRTRMFRTQSVFSPQTEQMTVSWHSGRRYRFARHAASVDDGLSCIRHVRDADVAETWSYSLGSSAIASIETSRPWGRRTCAGAERAGGGSGMWRA